MALKHTIVPVILTLSTALILFVSFSCNKNNSTTVVATTSTIYANIDSMIGTYTGTTSGDSVYTYTDSITGQQRQWVRGFSAPDTITVSSPDTINIVVTSKYYTANFAYGDSLTITSVNATTDIISTSTLLQSTASGQNTTFNDTASGINHLIINIGYTGAKTITSNVLLYNRL